MNAEFNNILTNAYSLISPLTGAIDLDGYALTVDAAGVTTLTSSAAVALSYTPGAKSGTPGTTGSIANFVAHTFTDTATAALGTATAYTGFAIQRPTLAASNAVTTTDAATLYVPNAPAAGTNETITNAYALWTDDGRVRHDLTATVVSAAGATLDAMTLPAVTATISGGTNITNATGVNLVSIGQPTLSAASALTVTNAATLYIGNAPTGGGAGPATITNAYALWVDNGAARFDGVVTVVDGSFSIIGSSDATKKALFEVDGLTTATSRTITVPDSNVTLGMPRAYISGLTYANNAGDATNDLDIAAGACTDSTNAVDMVLSSTLTKQSDVVWAVGSGNGGLDTGAVGNSDYYIWLIKRPDTGVVDALYSLSSTAPTMPTNYSYKRLIGWFKRTGGTIVAFHTYETEGGGLELSWDVPTLDVNLANTLTTANRSDSVKTPQNFSTEAFLNIETYDAVTPWTAWFFCPDQTGAAPSVTVAPLSNQRGITAKEEVGQFRIRTSATGTISARADLATVDNYRVVTLGFKWARRNS